MQDEQKLFLISRVLFSNKSVTVVELCNVSGCTQIEVLAVLQDGVDTEVIDKQTRDGVDTYSVKTQPIYIYDTSKPKKRKAIKNY